MSFTFSIKCVHLCYPSYSIHYTVWLQMIFLPTRLCLFWCVLQDDCGVRCRDCDSFRCLDLAHTEAKKNARRCEKITCIYCWIHGTKLCFFDFSCFFILGDYNGRHNDEVNVKIGINKCTLAARITDSPSIFKKT